MLPHLGLWKSQMLSWVLSFCFCFFRRIMKIIGLKLVGRNHYDPESAVILGKHRSVASSSIRKLTPASIQATLLGALSCLCVCFCCVFCFLGVFLGCRSGQAMPPASNIRTEAYICVWTCRTKSWGMTLCWMSCKVVQEYVLVLVIDLGFVFCFLPPFKSRASNHCLYLWLPFYCLTHCWSFKNALTEHYDNKLPVGSTEWSN